MLNDVLRQLKYDFLVPIDEHYVGARCVTLSDLEHYVYNQVSEFRMNAEHRDEFRVSVLERINRVAERDLSEPLTIDDMDTDLAQLALKRMTDSWDQTMVQIGGAINRWGYEVETPKWASVLYGGVLLILLGVVIFLWVQFGLWIGILSLIGALVVSSIASHEIPYRAVKNKETLRSAIDSYIDEVEQRVMGVSLLDIQLRVRTLHASFWKLDSNEVGGDRPLIPKTQD